LLLLLASPVSSAWATNIAVSGNIDPDPAVLYPNQWTSSTTVYIGKDSIGTIKAYHNAQLVSGTSYIAYQYGTSGSFIELSGTGTSWTTGDLVIGHIGDGSLTIENGAAVANASCSLGTGVGAGSPGSGTVSISGSSSKWTITNDLTIGDHGTCNITQDGGLVTVGGTLKFTNMSYAKGTYNLNDGTLAVSNISPGAGTATFNFNGGTLQANATFSTDVDATLTGTDTIDTQAYDITWNGNLTGTGELVKTGSGTLTLAGAYTYTGGTYVKNGTLAVNSGFTSSSTSTLKIGVTPSSCGVLAVTGTATVDGTLEVTGSSGTYSTTKKYTFLTATTSVLGMYQHVTDDLTFYDVVLTYDGSDIYFMLVDNGKRYVDEARTFNEYGVAGYLDAQRTSATGDFATVLDALNSLDGDGARAAFNAMSGEVYGSLATIAIENNDRFLRTIANRMRTESMANNADFAAADDCREQSLVYVNRKSSCFDSIKNRLSGWTTWFDSYGIGASIAGNGNASGLGYSTGGMAVGMERYLDDRTLFGFGGGYASSKTTLDARSDWGSIDGGQCVVYVRRDNGCNYLTGAFAYGYNNYAAKRHINFSTIDRTANASYGGNNYSSYFEVGRNIYGSYANLQPFAALESIGVQQNAFSEQNADSIDLQVNTLKTSALRGLLGTRILNYYRTGMGRLLTLDASAAWRHEFLDDSHILDASFVGQTGGAFAVSGVNVDRDAAIFGVGMKYALSDNSSLYANYDLLLSQNYTAHAGLGGFQYAW
jgi:T5SS/PEP-CTERM-associated repeat protein/autotransporter-associated beta strand protein